MNAQTIYNLLRLCVSSWDHYRRYSEKISNTRKFIGWLNDNEYGVDKIKENAQKIYPYSFQKSAIEKLFESVSEGNLLVIEAPTASGKTEVPFIPFLTQICTKNFEISPRLIYSLPLKSLSNVMWERAATYLLATLIEMFREAHEIEKFFKEKNWFKNGVLELPIGLETGSLIKEGDFLYGGFIIIGTIDSIIYAYVSQRFPGGLRNPRLSLPSGLLSTSLFVLDEVQMLQDEYYYSPRILNIILRQLTSVHTPIIVMTATMPTELKNIMLNDINYVEAVGEKSERGKVSIDVSFLKQGEKILDVISSKDIIKEIKDNIEQDKHSLIVTNRVSTAIEAYNILSQKFNNRVVLIHGKLNANDREKVEKKIGREKGLIIVATQVIESGYDFNAGLIVSEIAPLDSLLQRIGRVARKKTETGKAFIVNIEESKPYHQNIINTTKNLLVKEETDVFEEALQDIEITRHLLDEVYKKEYIENFIGEKNMEFACSIRYLHNLRLFSLPPRDIDFTFRPEMYVTLITTSDERLRGQIDKIEQTEDNLFSREKFEEFKEILENNSLNTSTDFANYFLAKRGLLYGKLNVYSIIRTTKDKKKRSMIKVEITNKDKKKQKVRPLDIWLLEPHAYKEGLGIVTGIQI